MRESKTVEMDRIGAELARIHKSDTYTKKRFAPRPAKCTGCGERKLKTGARALIVSDGRPVVVECLHCGKKTVDGKIVRKGKSS